MQGLWYWLVLVLPSLGAYSQAYESDWDTYLLQVEGKPVSVLVDMGLRGVAPMPGRPQAVLIRTKLQQPQPNGLPGAEESLRLDSLEEQLVAALEKGRGAVYAGRYSQRGLRTFHFFTADTAGQATALWQVFAGYADYAWMARTVADSSWSNYLDILYPPPLQRELMRDRRLIDHLRQKGDALTTPRQIDHFLYFPSKSKRMEFLRQPGMDAFTVAEMSEADPSRQALPYLLRLRREDLPSLLFVEKVITPLRTQAASQGGQYEGWQTHLVR